MTQKSRSERILLISDLHLEEDRPDLVQAFLSFLEREAANACDLYILGDFFNLWIGDDDDRPLNTAIAGALKLMAEDGLNIYLMHGNRDFLLGNNFARRAGATLIQEPFLLQNAGSQYLLMHGDVLCTRDVEYQAFRQTVRNPSWQQDFLGKPLAERRAFADQTRRQSKVMSSNKAADIMDVSQNAVENVLRENGTCLLIHGHTHRPFEHTFTLDGKAARRTVLGDWGTDGWFLELESGRVKLHKFQIPG